MRKASLRVSYFELAQKIEKGELFFEVDDAKSEIIEELEMIRMKGIDRDNKLQIYSKDEIKKTIGRSPDYSDMIMMRMYFELSYNTSSFTFTNYR
jgi:phage terminase large subunit